MSANKRKTSPPPESIGDLVEQSGDFARPPRVTTGAPRVGELVGDFVLDAVVGRGSAGTVYRAHHAPTGETVAIKLLNGDALGDAETRGRFAREARAGAAVRHPNIVRVLDAGESVSGEPFLVLEFLDGWDLASEIDRGPLSVDDALFVGRGLLRGLEAVHVRGYVHRDIKPQNVFLSRGHDGRRSVKLLDFGVVRPTVRRPRSKISTEEGVLLGTPCYMAPEQITEEVPVTERSDLYGVGALLFACLAGAPPIDDDAFGALLVRIVREDAPDIRTRRPDVPAALANVIARALSRSPAGRYASAAEMGRALDAV